MKRFQTLDSNEDNTEVMNFNSLAVMKEAAQKSRKKKYRD